MNRVNERWVMVALVVGALFASVGARADMIVEMDNADTSATVFGSGCFLSTFRILYQGDNYLACEGVGGAQSRGLTWDMANAPRESGGGFFYENNGMHCIYAKWADGAARWNNTRYQIDWNFGGSFVPDLSIGVDQQRNGGQWVRLACSTAPVAGSRAAVRCSNFGIPAGRYAICDGIKVVREQVDGGDIVDGTVTGSDTAFNSIPSTDLSNEAGVEFTNGGSCAGVGTTVQNCATTQVTAPSSGWVMVQCKAYAIIFGSDTVVELGVSTASTTIGEYTRAGLLDGNDTIRRAFPMHTFAVFPVSAGTRTFYCNAQKESVFSANTVNLGNLYMGATFFPTSY